MTLVTLRPLLLALILFATGAGLTWWGLGPRIDLQAARAEQAEQRLAESRQLIDLQSGVLAEQQRQLGAVTELERRLRQLGQDITRNVQAQSRALEELKRNDQEISDYLAGAVPAALGRLYRRPETTDPTAYRSPDPLSPDPLPPAGQAGAGEQ